VLGLELEEDVLFVGQNDEKVALCGVSLYAELVEHRATFSVVLRRERAR
jgi:hypothetical protein